MIKSDYKVVPPTISSPKDLLTFLRAIPAKYWCVDIRDNRKGQHCVLGHLDNIYGFGRGRDGFTEHELAITNNGTLIWAHGPRKSRIKTTGQATKNRVLKFVRLRMKQPPQH